MGVPIGFGIFFLIFAIAVKYLSSKADDVDVDFGDFPVAADIQIGDTKVTMVNNNQ